MVKIIPLQTIDYQKLFKTDYVFVYNSFNAFCGTQRIMLRFRADALRSKRTP